MTSSFDSRKVIAKKKVDGYELQLKRWTSDFIRPGRICCQLALVSPTGSLTTQFPIDWENYGVQQVRNMYDSVSSVEDFDRLRRETTGR